MRWSEAVTLEFVKLYLKHECLWNPAHSDYKQKYARTKAYEYICTDFKASTDKMLTLMEVKMKIRALRTTYAQQVQKILQRSVPDSIYEPSLIWFHEMDQCLKHITPSSRQSCNNEISGVNTQQVWMSHHMQNSSIEESTTDPIISQTEDEYESKLESSDMVPKRKHSQSNSKKIKKKKIKHRNHSTYSTDSNTEQLAKEDEFDVYGKYIATQLRQMSVQRALRVQLEIQNLVSEARISEIHTD